MIKSFRLKNFKKLNDSFFMDESSVEGKFITFNFFFLFILILCKKVKKCKKHIEKIPFQRVLNSLKVRNFLIGTSFKTSALLLVS